MIFCRLSRWLSQCLVVTLTFCLATQPVAYAQQRSSTQRDLEAVKEFFAETGIDQGPVTMGQLYWRVRPYLPDTTAYLLGLAVGVNYNETLPRGTRVFSQRDRVVIVFGDRRATRVEIIRDEENQLLLRSRGVTISEAEFLAFWPAVAKIAQSEERVRGVQLSGASFNFPSEEQLAQMTPAQRRESEAYMQRVLEATRAAREAFAQGPVAPRRGPASIEESPAAESAPGWGRRLWQALFPPSAAAQEPCGTLIDTPICENNPNNPSCKPCDEENKGVAAAEPEVLEKRGNETKTSEAPDVSRQAPADGTECVDASTGVRGVIRTDKGGEGRCVSQSTRTEPPRDAEADFKLEQCLQKMGPESGKAFSANALTPAQREACEILITHHNNPPETWFADGFGKGDLPPALPPAPVEEKTEKKRNNWAPLLIFGAIALAMIGFVYFMNRRGKDQPVALPPPIFPPAGGLDIGTQQGGASFGGVQ